MPVHTEILVSSLSRTEVVKRLDLMTREVNYLDYEEYSHKQKFNGRVKPDSFHLSLKMDRADTFLPLITGKIESTNQGSILFISYTLFPGAIFFLYFWLAIAMIMGMYFTFLEDNLLFGTVSLLIGLANMAFAWHHFNRKVKTSQQIFHKMLDLQNKG
ncbi:hypothetical protein [Litoribacter populi]|uniref:hypothetical protein n=1 Tax=Litoribacter populi TaxID=2598460 RepID=UPI0011816521|nr:hypothetical protein [Litoribacter populi]